MTPDLIALVAFLRARLDEQERDVYRWDSDGRARVASMWTGDDSPGYVTVACDHGDGRWVADGREVADGRVVRVLWDPAQTLREVVADRRIVDACVPHVIRADDCGQLARGALFALAIPHSSHPDYREDWRPDA